METRRRERRRQRVERYLASLPVGPMSASVGPLSGGGGGSGLLESTGSVPHGGCIQATMPQHQQQQLLQHYAPQSASMFSSLADELAPLSRGVSLPDGALGVDRCAALLAFDTCSRSSRLPLPV